MRNITKKSITHLRLKELDRNEKLDLQDFLGTHEPAVLATQRVVESNLINMFHQLPWDVDVEQQRRWLPDKRELASLNPTGQNIFFLLFTLIVQLFFFLRGIKTNLKKFSLKFSDASKKKRKKKERKHLPKYSVCFSITNHPKLSIIREFVRHIDGSRTQGMLALFEPSIITRVRKDCEGNMMENFPLLTTESRMMNLGVLGQSYRALVPLNSQLFSECKANPIMKILATSWKIHKGDKKLKRVKSARRNIAFLVDSSFVEPILSILTSSGGNLRHNHWVYSAKLNSRPPVLHNWLKLYQ